MRIKKPKPRSDKEYTKEELRQDTVEVCKKILQSEIEKLKAENDKLKSQIEKAEAVVKFYSDIKSWSYHENNSWSYQAIDSSDDDFVDGFGETAGKRAREYFKEREGSK